MKVHLYLSKEGAAFYIPIRGTEEAAGGVESARRRSNKKKATNTFIPGRHINKHRKNNISKNS